MTDGGERPPDYLEEEPFADAAFRAERIASGDLHDRDTTAEPDEDVAHAPGPAGQQAAPPGPASSATDLDGTEPAPDPAEAKDRWASVRSMVPAALAALGESGLAFLLVRSTVVEATGATTGPLVLLWAFVALDVALVAAGALARGFHLTRYGFAAAGVVLAVVQAGPWTGAKADVATALLVGIVALLVALRAAVLALRDWNDPAGGAFAWGAFLLLGAVLLGSHGGFDDALPVVVPMFFLGHMASRAAVVVLYGAPTGGGGGVTGRILRLAGGSLAALTALFVVLGPVGRRSGLLGFLGRLVNPVVGVFAAALTWVLVQLARPFLWLAERFEIDVDGVRRLLDRLGQGADGEDRQRLVREGSSIERLAALALLLLAVAVIVWAIRWQRDRLERLAREAEELPGSSPVEVRRRSRPRLRHRRELPAEAVRRWYAEVLIALEDHGLDRDPTWTPAELLERATEAFPEASGGLRALTRAYERVRYGAATLSEHELDAARRAHRDTVAALRAAPSLQPAD